MVMDYFLANKTLNPLSCYTINCNFYVLFLHVFLTVKQMSKHESDIKIILPSARKQKRVFPTAIPQLFL